MKDTSKTRGQLIAELNTLRRELRDQMDAESDAAKAEEAMWQTQIALLALFNNLPGMAYRTAFPEEAPRGRVEFVSGGCLGLTGYPAAAYVNDPSFYREHIVHPADREAVRQIITQAEKNHESYELTYRIVTQDGKTRWLNEHGTGLYDGAGKLVAREGFITDITENVSQLNEIRRQHAQLQKLTRAVEQAHELIMIGDRRGIVQYVNKAFENATGYSREEMVGTLPSVAVPDPGKKAFFRRVLRQLQAGNVWQGRYISTRKDGVLFELEATVSPIFSEDGQFDGYVAQQRDTTQASRCTADDRSVQRLEVLGIVAGSFVRDLNNQLQAILGYGKLALDSEALNETVAQHLKNTLKAAERASHINAEFLEFLRNDRDERGVVSLTEQCNRAVRLLRASLPVNIGVGGQLTDDQMQVEGVPADLIQALVTLGITAARPLRAHGGTLNVRLDHLESKDADTAGVVGPAGTAAIRIIAKTNGSCRTVPPETPDDATPASAVHAGGSPSSLAVIRELILEHGGQLHVEVEARETDPPQYVVILPLTDKPLSNSDHESQDQRNGTAAHRHSPSGHVMFVDDEQMLTELAQLELQDVGYRVTSFTSPTDALQAYERDPQSFDIVIADQTMPTMTGFDLARHMLKTRPDLPIILITGYSDVVNDLQARAVGIRDYLIKPITPETLAEAVANALAG